MNKKEIEKMFTALKDEISFLRKNILELQIDNFIIKFDIDKPDFIVDGCKIWAIPFVQFSVFEYKDIIIKRLEQKYDYIHPIHPFVYDTSNWNCDRIMFTPLEQGIKKESN